MHVHPNFSIYLVVTVTQVYISQHRYSKRGKSNTGITSVPCIYLNDKNSAIPARHDAGKELGAEKNPKGLF